MLQEFWDQDRAATTQGSTNAAVISRTVIVLVVLTLVVTGLLMPVPIRGPQASPLADLAHAPIFATLALVILMTIPLKPADEPAGLKLEMRMLLAETWRSVLLVTFALSLFGIGMEYVQRHFGRRGSWSDVLLNTLGLAAGICLFWACVSARRERSWRRSLVLGAAGCCFLVAASARPAYELWLIYSGHVQ
jgi:hypothetical protein